MEKENYIGEFTVREVTEHERELQKKVEELTKNRDFWMEEHAKVTKKFSAFRDMVKGIIVLID